MEKKPLMLDYLKRFEQLVAQGILLKKFGKCELASTRGSKLGKTKFGIWLGFTIDSDIDFIIDYYGYFKKSRGFNQKVMEYHAESSGKQIKAIETIIVHFPSIRIEQIADINDELIGGFPTFKACILKKRGFKKKCFNLVMKLQKI